MTKEIKIVVVFFCILKLALHVIADGNSGFQGDELLHISTGNHPNLGYMEFPPVIGWLAYLQNLLQSQSVFVHHIFTHVASTLILIIVALTTVQLGGRTKAVFFVLLCILIAPAFGRGHQLFQPVVFSHLFWLLSFYQLVRFTKGHNPKYLLYLSICVGFGFLTKYDIVFFIVGLVGLLHFKSVRDAIKPEVVKCSILFIAIILPNIIWQYRHDVPILDMFSRLYETQLNALTATKVISQIVISLNPLTTIFWIAGAIYMFTEKSKSFFKPVAFSIAISIFALALVKSKAYYFYPAIITLLIFGSIWFEKNILIKRKWIIYPTTSLLILSGLVLIPYGLAVLPLNEFIEFAEIRKNENNTPIEYTEYYSKSKWEKTMTTLQIVHESLPTLEQKSAIIWGKHYSQAGGINLFRSKYNLPNAISYHGSFYLWAPKSGRLPSTVLAISNGEAGIDFFQSFFNDVKTAKQIFNPYANSKKDLYQTIYICRQPKYTFEELNVIFKSRVFE